jgi:hypothetical protein
MHAWHRVSHEKSHLASCHPNMHRPCIRGTTGVERKLGANCCNCPLFFILTVFLCSQRSEKVPSCEMRGSLDVSVAVLSKGCMSYMGSPSLIHVADIESSVCNKGPCYHAIHRIVVSESFACRPIGPARTSAVHKAVFVV